MVGPQCYSALFISTVFVVKCIIRLILCAAQVLIDSIFTLLEYSFAVRIILVSINLLTCSPLILHYDLETMGRSASRSQRTFSSVTSSALRQELTSKICQYIRIMVDFCCHQRLTHIPVILQVACRRIASCP